MFKIIFSCALICFLSACGFHPDYRTAQYAHKNQDYAQAIMHLEPLADFGLANAQSKLGRMYLKGEGVEVNIDKAYALFQKAALKNQPTAHFYLGYIAEKGLRGRKDGQTALAQYIKADAFGFRSAPFYYGRLYHQGTLISKDVGKAQTAFQKAMDNNYPKAAYHMGKIYEKGESPVKKDLEKALQYYQIAADIPYAPAEKAIIRVKNKLKK